MFRKLAASALLFALACAAADWLNQGGDPHRSGWQRSGPTVSVPTAAALKLLWKLPLQSSLSAPVIIGPTITHRGVRELVIVAGAADTLYAIDADLGRVFWKRSIDTASMPSVQNRCASGLTAAPAIAPDPDSDLSDDDDDDDEDLGQPSPMRPVYVLASDGRLHTIRVSDGADIAKPVQFVPPGARASSLTVAQTAAYTTTSGQCAGVPDGVWAIDVTRPGATPAFHALKGAREVSAGFDGLMYAASEAEIVALTPGSLKLRRSSSLNNPADVPMPFRWNGIDLLGVAGGSHLSILNASTLKQRTTATGVFTGGIATWRDASATRWIYAAESEGIAAFRITGTGLARAWTLKLTAPTAPVVTNGVVFVIARAILYALDAVTGRQLYSSGDSITSLANSNALAIANGHVCFTTADNAAYCFGIPLDK